jgi:23S rRNA-/tRNA-specific pseudouridylate synthase
VAERRVVEWVVRSVDGSDLSDVLSRLGAPETAVADGRVFIDDRRVEALAQQVVAGQVVRVYAARQGAREFRVLGERDGILAVDKGAELPTEPDRTTREQSLQSLVATELGLPATALHAASRLDVGVSGIVLFTRTPEAARRLVELRAAGGSRRRYVAIGAGSLHEPQGTWRVPIVVHRREQAAQTHYQVVASTSVPPAAFGSAGSGTASLLVLAPETGRLHQLRFHCSAAHIALLGDRRYGGPARLRSATGTVRDLRRIALHAFSVDVALPSGTWRVRAAPPTELVALWRELGGADCGWDTVSSAVAEVNTA